MRQRSYPYILAILFGMVLVPSVRAVAGIAWDPTLSSHPEACRDTVASHDPDAPLIVGNRIDSDRLHQLSGLARQGDEGAQTEILLALYETVPRVIRGMSKRPLSDERLEELTQRVIVRVVSRNYEFDRNAGNEGRQVQFSTWIGWYIRGVLTPSAYDQRVKLDTDLSKATEVGEDTTSVLEQLSPRNEGTSQHEITAARQNFLREQVLPLLGAQEAYLLREHTLNNVSTKEIGRRKRRSQTTIYHHVQRMRECVRTRLTFLETNQIPSVQEALKHFPGSSALKDAFVYHAFDGTSFPNLANQSQSYDQNAERYKFLRAIQIMADWTLRHRPDDLRSFWLEMLALSPVHQTASQRLVDSYLATGAYPTSDTTDQLFADWGMTGNRVFGKIEGATTLGPNTARLYLGDEHAYWAIGHEVGRRLAQIDAGNLDVPALAERRLRDFSPFLWARPRLNPDYHFFYLELISDFREQSQELIVDKALDFALREGRFPAPLDDLLVLSGVTRDTLFGHGPSYAPGGVWSRAHCFEGIPGYSRLLHAKRLLRIEGLRARVAHDPTAAETVRVLYNLALQDFSPHTQTFNGLPADFVRAYPTLNRYWPQLRTELQNYAYQRFVLKHSIRELSQAAEASPEELLGLEGRFFQRLFENAAAEDMRTLSDECLNLNGVFSDAVGWLVDAFEEDGICRDVAQSRSLLTEKALQKYQIAQGQILLGRVFFDSDHRIAMLVQQANRRVQELQQAPEFDSNPVLQQRVARLQTLTAHQFVRGFGAGSSKCHTLYDAAMHRSRPQEQKRIARLVLQRYLETNETLSLNRVISWIGISAHYFLSNTGNTFYFDSSDHFYQVLAAESTAMAADRLLTLSPQERTRLKFVPSELRRFLGKELSPKVSEASSSPLAEYWTPLLTHMTRTQAEVFRLHHFESQTFSTIATGMKVTEPEVLAHYFKAIGIVILSSPKTESFTATYLDEVQKLNGPHSQIIKGILAQIEETGQLPSEQTVTEFVPAEFSWLSPEQLLGRGEFQSQGNGPTARVFAGFTHLTWALYREIRSRSDLGEIPNGRLEEYTPFQIPFTIPARPSAIDHFALSQFCPEERQREKERVKKIWGELRVQLSRPPTLEEVAQAAGITADEIAARKNFRAKANHGYRRVFENPADYLATVEE